MRALGTLVCGAAGGASRSELMQALAKSLDIHTSEGRLSIGPQSVRRKRKCLMVASDLIWQFAVGSALVNTGVPLSHGWRGQRPDETIVGSQIIAQRAVEIGAEIGCPHFPERPGRPDQIAHGCALDLGDEVVGHLPWHKETRHAHEYSCGAIGPGETI